MIVPNTWVEFILSSILVCLSALIIGSLFILPKKDIEYIFQKIRK